MAEAERDRLAQERLAAQHDLVDARLRLDPPSAGAGPLPVADDTAAMAWFDAEHECLLAAQQVAANELHRAVWGLAWAAETFLRRRGHRSDRLGIWQRGLHAVEHLDDPTASVLTHRLLGRAHGDLG